jgi:hypothetical protein
MSSALRDSSINSNLVVHARLERAGIAYVEVRWLLGTIRFATVLS